ADLVQRLVRGPTGNHSGSLLTSLTGGSRRFRKFSGTVCSGLIVTAELGRGLATRSILRHERFQFAVEGCGFQRGERLVQDVVVLFGQQVAETVGDAGADPHADGAPAELLDRRQ